ncbi:MAG TPA: hypothetical protein VFQ44_17280 [Streptosporangiaceae bacterium]|nr:hypothetical protein [Streptosporangiaceae bacterium]
MGLDRRPPPGTVASWDEFGSEYLDALGEDEWDAEIYDQVSEYADEQLRDWGGRLQLRPTVRKIVLPSAADEHRS